MRPPAERVVACVLGLALCAVACNRGPAEEAVAVAEQALETAEADLERYVPEKRAELKAALDDARAALEKGRYTEALRAAQALPARIHAAEDRVQARRAAAGAAWEKVARSLPSRLGCLRSRISRLAAAQPPPPESWLGRARSDLRALRREWEEAQAASGRGDLAEAADVARAAGTHAEELAERLGGLPGC